MRKNTLFTTWVVVSLLFSGLPSLTPPAFGHVTHQPPPPPQSIATTLPASPLAVPSTPSNPNPSNGATLDRTSDTDLSWSTDGTSCDVHIWGGSININLSGGSCASLHLGNQYGGSYQWQVTAHNSSGATIGPIWRFYIKPYGPTNLTAATGSPSSIDLSWTKSNDDPGSVDGYNVYFSDGSFITTLGAGSTSYSVGELACNSPYAFYVTSFRQGVESDPSNTASAYTEPCRPTPPSNPNPADGATVDRTTNITFTWSTDGTSCDIHISGGPSNNTIQNGIYCLSFHWGQQWPGSYQWQVTAYNSYGTTTGPVWSLKIRPYSPTNLNASTGSLTSINLSWTKSADDPGNVDSYNIRSGNGTLITSLAAGATGYTVNGLNCGTSYSYYVTAVRQGVESRPSNIASASTGLCLTIMRIAPSAASANVGSPITVAVEISNVANLGGFQFTLNYSPTLVTVQGVTLGGFPNSTGRSFTPVGPTIDNVTGSTVFGAYSPGPTPPGPYGAGVLAYVQLRPMADGTDVLRLSNVQLSDVPGNTIPVVTQAGTLSIASCLGDFDGDSDVDILDVQRIAYRWNTHTGDPLYDLLYDVNPSGAPDGDIDIFDVQTMAYRLGTRCSSTFAPTRLTATPPITLSIQPSSQTVTAGQTFTVGVSISDVIDLGAFQYTLAYSPTIVEVVSVTLGSFPGSTGRAFVPVGPDTSTPGEITFGGYSLGANPPGPNGSGTLAVLTLLAKCEGAGGLNFVTAQVGDRSGSEQSIGKTNNGQVAVTNCQMSKVFLPLVLRNYPPVYAVSGRITSNGQPLAGATVATNAGQSANTGVDGTYSFFLPAGNYTLTSSLVGYTFTPASRVVTVPPDAAVQDFTAVPVLYAISGRITSNGQPLAGVHVATNSGQSTTTGVDGNYSFSLLAGSYTLTPSLSGYTFTPSSRTVTVPPATTTQDFTAAQPLVAISGRITNNGQPLAGVTVATNVGQSATTGANGTYSLTLLAGTYILTPSLAGYTFTPPSRIVTVPPESTAQDFAAVQPLYPISGRITSNSQPLAGVTVALNVGQSTNTGSDGTYTFTLPAGTYTLTASLTGYTFSPSSRIVTVPPAIAMQDFTATPPPIDLVINGSFETNSAWYIPITEYTAGYTTAASHSGSHALRNGITNPYDNRYSYSSGYQAVSIPANASSAILRFWLYPMTTESPALALPPKSMKVTPDQADLYGDAQYVLILNQYDQEIARLVEQRSNAHTWVSYGFDLKAFAGQTIKVYFDVYNNGWNGITSMYVDDVSLEVRQPQTTLVYSLAGDGEVINQACVTWAECRGAASGDFAYNFYQGATVASSYVSGTYTVKRVFFYFDTSVIPANATLQSVTLNFYAGQFQNGSHRRVHVAPSTQASPLSGLDFGRLIFTSGGFWDLAANTWAQIALNATGQTWIAKGGTTRLALVNDLDMNNIVPTEANDSLISMAEDSAHRPYLTVRYTIP